MKILGVDSSGMVASAAIVQDDLLVAEYSVNYKKTHSETLLPMIDEIVTMTQTDLNELDAIAISAGPGSFTGLRIGSATVKGLGLALEKPIISIPSCEALAYNVWGFDGIVCPIMDARRSQVYCGIYAFEETANDNKLSIKTLRDQDAIGIEDFIEIIDSEYSGKNVCFVGDGVPVYRKVIEEKMKNKFCFAPAHANRQRAAAVASLGQIYMAAGKIESAEDHKPIYLRKSQAEREREARENS